MRSVGLAMLVAVLAGSAAGCASAQPEAAPATSAPALPAATPASTAPAPLTVPDTLKFTAITVDGKPFDAATLAGKPTVFWFWAAWCSNCKGDAAGVRDLQAAVAANVNVVGVAGLKSGSDGMRKFVADYRLTSFPQLADDKGEVWKRFEVPSQHYYVVLDASGRVVHRGPLSVDQLRKTIGA